MRQKFSNLSWARILIASVLVIVVDVGLIALVVMGYAFKLGFEARGAPDQARIQEFAGMVGPLWGSILGILFTLAGAAWVARKSAVSSVANGVAVGVVVAVVSLVFDRSINLVSLAAFVLTVIAGWLGGLVGRWRRSAIEESGASGEGAA